MTKWRIDTLSQQELAKYRQRSARAINGLHVCLKDAGVIAQYEKISDKYKIIADYMGLGQEDGNSFYNFFVPLNADIVFLLRNANHNNMNPKLYNRHEQLGRPNKRYVIYFKKGNSFSDTSTTFLEAEHHVIPYNVNALDNEASVVAYINSLINLFENGETTFQPLPITTENKQYNKNTNMNKKLIRLTESDLRKIVKESVNRVLNEIQYGGESLHGNSPTDWEALSQVRAQRAYDEIGDNIAYDKEFNKCVKNRDAANEIGDDVNINGRPYYYRNGWLKADRILKNLGHPAYQED